MKTNISFDAKELHYVVQHTDYNKIIISKKYPRCVQVLKDQALLNIRFINILIQYLRVNLCKLCYITSKIAILEVNKHKMVFRNYSGKHLVKRGFHNKDKKFIRTEAILFFHKKRDQKLRSFLRLL